MLNKLLIMIFSLSMIGAKPSSSTSSSSLSLNARDWITVSDPANYLLLNPNNTLALDLMYQPSTINYLYTTHIPRSVSGSLQISMQFIGAAPVFYFYDPCGSQSDIALVHPYFQSRSDWSSNDARWWSHLAFSLIDGNVNLTIPLLYTEWSNVIGQTSQSAFTDSLSHISSLGVTFGNQCFFGHGIGLYSGSGRFSISQYKIVN